MTDRGSMVAWVEVYVKRSLGGRLPRGMRKLPGDGLVYYPNFDGGFMYVYIY